MAKLNERLLQLKSERNLLQKDIASSLEISLRSYQRYETGEREPTSSVIIALADYFNVSADYLLGLSDDPTRH